MNFYAFFRAKSIFHFSGITQFIITIFLVLLILAPIIIKLVEKLHLETAARSIAYLGYLWMAFIFLFCFFNLTFDIVRYGLKFFYQNAGSLPMKNIFFSLAVFLAVFSVVYGFFDAKKIRIQKLEFHTINRLPNDGRIRIVQISDVHVGLIIRGKRLEDILDRVDEYKPDILVSTGDLLDGELDNVTPEAIKFAQISAKYGKFAVTGNHEYYAGIKKSLEFTQKAGFEVLQDEVRQVAGIKIVGLNDETGRKSTQSDDRNLFNRLMPGNVNNQFTLLLRHQPYINQDNNFNLQLSGHTHGGQIFPFMFFTRLFFPRNYGYYELGTDKAVYVSKGAGTWGPPVRFLAPPEITVIDIINK
jgi:predicted MPP superfamily phosphohydrolase